MADISHIHYTGASKVIHRLCGTVNALVDGGGGGDSAAIAELQAQIAAIREALEALPNEITASVENDILILTGAGASVKGTRLILVSNSVSASGDTLTFETG